MKSLSLFSCFTASSAPAAAAATASILLCYNPAQFTSIPVVSRPSPSVTITAKVTSNNESKGAGDDSMAEPQSWWQRKKKSLEKFNRRARRKCRTAVKSQVTP